MTSKSDKRVDKLDKQVSKLNKQVDTTQPYYNKTQQAAIDKERQEMKSKSVSFSTCNTTITIKAEHKRSDKPIKQIRYKKGERQMSYSQLPHIADSVIDDEQRLSYHILNLNSLCDSGRCYICLENTIVRCLYVDTLYGPLKRVICTNCESTVHNII
jgi:hypothetical protein